MPPIPRPYQIEAIGAGVDFFHDVKNYNGIEILPTGSGKSIVVANIAKELKGKTVVFQPSKEILEQNYAKFRSYGYDASIYSASAGQKYIGDVTFATIGSVIGKRHLFKQCSNIIVDECHLVNPEEGMYRNFITSFSDVKVLGLTATPYRLTSGFEGAMLKWITRTDPRIFHKELYYIQNEVLFNAGHLAPLEYFDFDTIDRSALEMNGAGTDFTASSLRDYYSRINMPSKTASVANKILKRRKNLLVFCSLVDEAKKVSALVPGSVIVTGDTDKSLRSKILSGFKSGKIKCVINVGVLTTGFDFPELEAVLIARSTMSLALYYQIVGRVMRPHPNKLSGWVVDMGGNIRKFGKIETMKIMVNENGFYSIWNDGKRLTDVTFSNN